MHGPKMTMVTCQFVRYAHIITLMLQALSYLLYTVSDENHYAIQKAMDFIFISFQLHFDDQAQQQSFNSIKVTMFQL